MFAGQSASVPVNANVVFEAATRVPIAVGQGAGQYQADATTTNAYAAPIQAVIEPDGDSDAYGDATQDVCLGAAGTSSGARRARYRGSSRTAPWAALERSYSSTPTPTGS